MNQRVSIKMDIYYKSEDTEKTGISWLPRFFK